GSFTYTPDPDYNGPDSFTFKANDGSLDSNIATVSITVTPSNDAPSLTEGATFDLGSTNSGATSSDTLASDILTGTDYIDIDLTAVPGIAVTATTGNGTWEYSTDGGTTWVPFGTVDNTQSLLLSGNALVHYVPNGAGGETATFTFRAWDQTSGAQGDKVDTTSTRGTPAFPGQTPSATVTVVA